MRARERAEPRLRCLRRRANFSNSATIRAEKRLKRGSTDTHMERMKGLIAKIAKRLSGPKTPRRRSQAQSRPLDVRRKRCAPHAGARTACRSTSLAARRRRTPQDRGDFDVSRLSFLPNMCAFCLLLLYSLADAGTGLHGLRLSARPGSLSTTFSMRQPVSRPAMAKDHRELGMGLDRLWPGLGLTGRSS